MCLTLSNAAAIHHHIPPGGTAVRGYTSTAHHAGHLTPGDQWRPLTNGGVHCTDHVTATSTKRVDAGPAGTRPRRHDDRPDPIPLLDPVRLAHR